MNPDLVRSSGFWIAFYDALTVFMAYKSELSQSIFRLRSELKRNFVGRTTSHYRIYMGLTIDAIFTNCLFIFVANSREISDYPCIVNFADFISKQSFSEIV